MEEKKESKVLAILSLIFGIIGIICCCLTYFGMIIAAVGIILGIIVLVKKKPGKGLAIAGIICGGVGFLLALVVLVIGTSTINSNGGMYTYNGYSTNDPAEFIQYIMDSVNG